MLEPLRNRTGDNIGLIVYAFKVPERSNRYERKLYLRALDLRDKLAQRITTYESLFAPVK